MKTAIAVGRPDKTRLEYAVVTGSRDRAEDTARAAVRDARPLLHYDDTEPFDEALWRELQDEPSSLIVHIQRPDGSTETRQDSVVQHKPKPNQGQGAVNVKQTKRRAGQVANGERGRELPDPAERARLSVKRESERQAAFEGHVQGVLLDLSEKLGGTIAMNLLEKSGLTGNRVQRDLNLLDGAVGEAARHLHDEAGLAAELDVHFGHDRLAPPKQGKPRADGATVAALLWMNAAMLHQRVHAGGWLGRRGLDPLTDIKSSPEPEDGFSDSWNAIARQDFLPVIEPAMEALRKAQRTGRLGGLRRALRHLAAEAEEIAEIYADMGTDHAGALFNKVMGDQSSDGAFFTRPVAADLAARLALAATDPDNTLDWSNPDVWRHHKTVDLACGSGTLLTALMTEMRRRAAQHGADRNRLAELQKVAVEEMLKGLDVNAVSLQLAATQLMSGNVDVKYRKMGLHLMPYGPQPDGTVAAGTPELFGRQDIAAAGRLFDDAATSTPIKTGIHDAPSLEGPEMDDAAHGARDARIVIMNPPFTNRRKMGEKFDKDTQEALRRRLDTLEGFLESADPCLSDFLDDNTLRPTFAALADLCLNRDEGVLATVIPTTALTNTSGLPERLELAKRFHIHTILTCHQARDVGLSQHSEISESIVVLQRHADTTDPSHPPTRVVSLDRLPDGDTEVARLFDGIDHVDAGTLPDGWGEVSSWPAERIGAGDWTAAFWRSPALADAASRFAGDNALRALGTAGLAGHSTQQQMTKGYVSSTVGAPGAFPILDGHGVDDQQKIEGAPDGHWVWQGGADAPILAKAGHLFLTTGQYMSATRLTALATKKPYVGRGWRPVTGATPQQAQALAVFINSTVGRMLLMRLAGSILHYPVYNTTACNLLPIPDINDHACMRPLGDCWEATRSEVVPQNRDGYTTIRRRWDAAVCSALGWDIDEITELGEMLAREPRVRGVAYGQWKA